MSECLFVLKSCSERFALAEVGFRDLEGSLCHSGVAHAVREPSPTQSLLCDVEPVVFLADRIFDGDADVLVLDLRVAAFPFGDAVSAEVWHVPDDVDAVRVRGNEDNGGPFVRMGVQIGSSHHQVKVSVEAVGGPPLVAVDDPLVSVPDRGRLEHFRIRTATTHRLGHRKRR